jgi:hypothetical protein
MSVHVCARRSPPERRHCKSIGSLTPN